MKTSNFIIYYFLLTIVIAGCKKETVTTPKEIQVSFSTDKPTYFPGETIHLLNNSLNANQFKWFFPDGTSSIRENTDYVIDPNMSEYSTTIKLLAFNQWPNKGSTLTKTIEISQPTFDSDFWGNSANLMKPVVKLYRYDTATKLSSLIALANPISSKYDGFTLIIRYKAKARPLPGIYKLSAGDMWLESTIGWESTYCEVCGSTSGGNGEIVVTQAAAGRVRIKFSIQIYPRVYGSHNPQNFYLSGDITF